MGYWYHNCYIDAETLAGQKDQEAKCDSAKLNKFKKRQRERLQKRAQAHQKWLESKWFQNGKDCVYFILDPDRDLIKIGTSRQLVDRFYQLRYSFSNIKLCGSIDGDYQDERALHKIFVNFRIDGEWFTPSKPILHYIKHFAERTNESN